MTAAWAKQRKRAHHGKAGERPRKRPAGVRGRARPCRVAALGDELRRSDVYESPTFGFHAGRPARASLQAAATTLVWSRSRGVAKHQKLRLIGAMVEVAGSEAGYAGANIKLLSTLAGVSRQTFYDRFGTTEACFLATYEYVVTRAARHVNAAFRSQQDWQEKLREAFDAYALEVVNEPKAARIALVEVLGAGPVALAERERGRQVFEHLIAASFRQTPGGSELPAFIVKAIVGGVERVTRLRLLNGGVEELPALADELLAWALSYSSPRVGAIQKPRASPLRHSARRATSEQDERTRILRAAAQVAADAGYLHLTRSQLLEHADVRVETFDELFESTEQCFLASLDLLAVEVLGCAVRASSTAETRVAAVRQGDGSTPRPRRARPHAAARGICRGLRSRSCRHRAPRTDAKGVY